MGERWSTPDGRWEVEPIILNNRPCYRVRGPRMGTAQYVFSIDVLQAMMGGAFGELIDPDEDHQSRNPAHK